MIWIKISRWIWTIAFIVGSYFEAGICTALSIFLIFIALEIIAVRLEDKP